MSLFEELKRRNVFKVALLYLVAAWLILQVADVLFDALELPASWLRLVLALLVLGFPLAVIFSWIFEMTPEGLKRERDLDRTADATIKSTRINLLITVLLVLAIATVVIDRMVPEQTDVADLADTAPQVGSASDPAVLAAAKFAPPPDRSIAVLPFVNMSGDPENEYFADGLSEEILNFLAGVPGLQVTARTSSFQFKGKNADVREVGEALNAAHVLEGSVRRAGNQARITAQLIRAADGYHLWSETYDRTMEDTFEVQTDIAESVSRALGVVLDGQQRQRMQAAGVRDVEAFIAFQKGQAKFWQAHSHEIDMPTMAEAADWFSEALRLEPRFASAYFMRSDYHAHRTTLYGVEDAERQLAYAAYMSDLEAAIANVTSPDERALIEVDRTMASDNWRTLPERFDAALASRSCAEGVWIELAPPFGKAEEYLAYTKAMIECDPLNFYYYYSAGLSALWVGRKDEAVELTLRGLEIKPDDAFLEAGIVLALLAQQRFDEARERAASRDLWNRELKLALVDAASGDVERARARAAEVIAGSGPWLRMFHTLQLSAVTGQREAANAAAAWFDRLPMGPMMLIGAISECLCGAPFDLEATPVLKQRLEEADAAWPPAKIIDYPAMRR
ncbi:MAG: hypothetical protein PVG91_03325 [Gammaproteobacteria bacterium]|jgi:TolB-like protein